MKKQDRIQFRRDEDLAAIDEHLDEAISELNATNERIAGLLDEIDGKTPSAPTADAQTAGGATGGDSPDEAPPQGNAEAKMDGEADGEGVDEAARTG